jgi:hypothetical protein
MCWEHSVEALLVTWRDAIFWSRSNSELPSMGRLNINDGSHFDPIRAQRIQICFVICSLLGSIGSSSAQETMYGLSYCAPPTTPKCIDAKETYVNDATIALCKAELSRYARTTIAYRDCLLLESRRAILQANKTIDRFKFMGKSTCHDHPGLCPGLH